MADGDIKATIGVDVLGTRELNTLIKYTAMLQDGISLTSRQLATFERLLAKVQIGAKSTATATKKQAESVDTLTAALTKLGAVQSAVNKAGAQPSGFATPALAARVALINQMAKETEKAAAAEAKFRAYQKASNERVSNLEGKDRAASQRAVNKEIAAEAAARKAAAAATAEQAAKQKALNDYIKASGARQAALEQRDLAASRKALTDQMAAQSRISQAQVQYAGAATRAGVQYGQALENVNQGLANQRYALYDVASTLGVISAATLGVAVAVESIGIAFEKNFASVERTSGLAGSQLENLKDQLVDISTTMPVAFEDVTKIATLGAQLGIASGNLDSFTKTISQFSATTDVSVESAAQSFGRLGQLTETPADEFANLGSAIYQVGITSVATESQILAVASQIAVAGNLAGFTADQTIALAGALASLGVQPEAARGSIARIFNIIETATQEGGEALDEFAKISGVTAQGFADAWENDPSRAFETFINGLGRAGEQGEFLSGILSDLGLKAVRDQNALKLLADNTEVYNEALQTSATAYGDGTALADGYQVVADTLAAKLQVLAQSLQAIAASAANLGVVKEVVDLLQRLADGLSDMLNSNVGKVFASIGLAILALTGILAGYMAAQALATASAYALRTAMTSLTASSGQSAIGVRALAVELKGLALSAGGAATALKVLATTTVIGAGLTAALIALPKIIDEATFAFGSAGDKAKTYFGDLSTLTEAIKKDTAEGGEGFRTITKEVETSNTELAPWAKNLQTATGAQVTLNEATTNTSTAVKEQTAVIGENAKAWLANAIANDTAFQQYYMKNSQALKAAGFDLKTFLDATLNTEGGGVEYLKGLTTELTAVGNEALTAATGAGAMNTEQQALAASAFEGTSALNGLLRTAESSEGAFQEAASAAMFTTEVNEALGLGAEIASDELDQEVASLQDVVGAATDAAFAMGDAAGAVANLGQSLYDNGTSFSAFSEAGRSNLSALQGTIAALTTAAGGDSQRLAVMLAGLMQSLAQYGVDTVNELAFVQAAIAQLTGGKGVGNLAAVTQSAAQSGALLGQGFQKGAAGVKKTGGAAKKAAKEIKTLTDYVSDLGSVFKNAFEIRFGLEQSLDGVADAWQKMADKAEDAREAIADATQQLLESDATIQGLNAAQTTLEYQLSVAQEYGDVLRANEILAEMAENNADLADEQKKRTKAEKELTKAQQAATPSLDGNTEASREQRDMVLGLIKSYQDQVLALANSGLSQQEVARRTQELKNQFIAQMIQMGYSREEVDRYAAAFDDLTLAIERVPRNITVSADTSPAQRALDEFLAKANSSTANATLTASGGGGAYQASGINVGPGGIYTPTIDVRQGIVLRDPNGDYLPGQRGADRVVSTGGLIPQYLARGGATDIAPKGHGPKGTDTVPAWLTPGEYVVNRSAVQSVGLPFMNALNSQQVPKYLSTGGPAGSGRSSGGGPTIQLVEFLPHQLQQIVQGLTATLALDGRIVAEASNNANAVSARRGSN